MTKASRAPGKHPILRQPLLLAAVLPLCLGLIGCAGLPKGVLTPVDVTVPRTSRVSLLVATTRAPSSDRAVLFSGERGEALKTTELTVSIPPPEN